MTATSTVLMVGDIILDDDDADRLFAASRALLAKGDLVIGHVEVPHTLRGEQCVVGVPGSGGDPARLAILAEVGFDVVTLAANHIFDYGPAGVADTIAALTAGGIRCTGAGMNIDEARRPAVVETGGVRCATVSYNCVGPRESWASAGKAGAAYVHTMKHLDGWDVYTFADPVTLRQMQEDIRAAKAANDIVIAALHKGKVHTPAEVLEVERQLAYAAIDAGADLVIGHHAHILRGVEFYRDVPIFHGLCNFVCVTDALSIDQRRNTSPERLVHAVRRRKLYNFEPDPAYPKYPFHPDARNSMVAMCDIGPGGVSRPGFMPLWIEPSGEPVPHGDSAKGRDITAYIERITREAGFDTDFRWDGDRVAVSPACAQAAR